MKNDLTRIYSGVNLSGATANVIYLPVVGNSTLEKVSVRTNAAQVGNAVFEVRKNGVVITGLAALTIASGAKVGIVSGLAIALADGDEIILNLVSGNVSSPITLNLRVDDGETGLPSQTGNAGKFLQTDGTAATWQKTPIEFGGACSDETTALTTGAAKLVFRSPGAVTLNLIRATLSTASSSGTVDLNVKKNGATIFTTKLTIDATEKTSKTAAANYVLVTNPTVFADDDELQIDIDAAGTGAKGLKVFFFGVR